jgi:hypothetical protein
MRHHMKGRRLHVMTQPLIPLAKKHERSYLSLFLEPLVRFWIELARFWVNLIYTILPKSTFTSVIAFKIKFKLMIITSCSALMAIMIILNPYLETWLSSQSTQNFAKKSLKLGTEQFTQNPSYLGLGLRRDRLVNFFAMYIYIVRVLGHRALCLHYLPFSVM